MSFLVDKRGGGGWSGGREEEDREQEEKAGPYPTGNLQNPWGASFRIPQNRYDRNGQFSGAMDDSH